MSETDKATYLKTYARIAQENRDSIEAKLRMLEDDGWDDEERQGLLDNIEEHKKRIAGCEASTQWLKTRVEEQLTLFK